MKAYRDRNGDVWYEVLPGRVILALSEKAAERFQERGDIGRSIHTVETYWGPLKPLKQG